MKILASLVLIIAVVVLVLRLAAAPLYAVYGTDECLRAYAGAKTLADSARLDLHPYKGERLGVSHRCGEVRAPRAMPPIKSVGGDPVGCYRATPALTYSATGRPEHGDTAWAIVRLFLDGTASRPLLSRAVDNRGKWTLRNDTLTVLVFDGLVGWRMALTTTERGWRGRARYLTDAIVVGQPSFLRAIELERRPCVPPA